MAGPSLYVHVPFCRARCSYCTFASYAKGDPSQEIAVVRRTIDQGRFWADRMGGLEPETVYVGGGTPSILSRVSLEQLLAGLTGSFPHPPAEFTMEANPDSLDEAFLAICAAHGVNRLSVGIQSFSPEVRRSAGRRCELPDLDACRELLATRWRGQVSLDLMAGFECQKPGDVVRDVDVAATWTPDHVSLYALTVDGRQSQPGLSPTADDLWLEGFDRLEARGYPNYEICNFAPQDRECRHNLVYWRLDPYLGLGPSAVSTLPDGLGGALRIQSPPELPIFLGDTFQQHVDAAERVAPQDMLYDTLIMGLRLRAGLDRELLERRLGRQAESVLPRTLASWARRSLLDPLPGRIALTREGRLVLDSLLVEAREEIDALAPGTVTFSWP